MAKFGLFVSNRDKAEQEFEGDYLEYSAQATCVAVSIMRNDGKGKDRAYAIVRLEEHQCIKEVK
jgi:hypothetical protein